MDNDQLVLKKNINRISNEQWKELFDLIPAVSRAKYFGKLIGMKKESDGIYPMPYFIHSKLVIKFTQISYKIGLIQSFDWPHWDRGKKLLDNADIDFNELSFMTLCKLIIVIVRADRFNDGYMVRCFEKGIILKILRALKIKCNR
jgi:hypothetical protein